MSSVPPHLQPLPERHEHRGRIVASGVITLGRGLLHPVGVAEVDPVGAGHVPRRRPDRGVGYFIGLGFPLHRARPASARCPTGVGGVGGEVVLDTGPAPRGAALTGRTGHRGQWKAVGRRDASRGRPCYARFIECSWSQTAAVVPPTVRDSSRLPTQLFPDPGFALPRWLDVAKDVLSNGTVVSTRTIGIPLVPRRGWTLKLLSSF